MGHVDVNRAGIVGAVILAGWHMAWSVLVAAGMAQRVMDFVYRLHSLKSDAVVQSFDPAMAGLLLLLTAGLGYLLGAGTAAMWNCLNAVCERGKTGSALRV
jgi:hypothetical protein